MQIYQSVKQSINENKGQMYFIYGHERTGKTFLWNTLISAIISTWRIVLVVALSDITSLLLPEGTTNSEFKIPLSISDSSTCQIKKLIQFARLIENTSLIL